MKKSAIFNISLAVILVAGVGASIVATVRADDAGETPVSEQSGEITFNTQTKVVGAQPEKYRVPYGSELELTLDLKVTGSGEAELANPPVEFPHGGPPDFRVRRVSPTRVVLTEKNDNQKPGEDDEYYFKARVSYDGEVYKSPDPTIINEGPPGGS
ncbi:MAG: hypothetical protein PVG07_09095 [Acidobacteriota bacterium]